MADSQWTDDQLAKIVEKIGGKYTIAGYALNRGYTAEFVLLAYFLFEGKTLDDARELAGAATLEDLRVTLKVTEYEEGMVKLGELESAGETADEANPDTDTEIVDDATLVAANATADNADVNTGETTEPSTSQVDEPEVELISREDDVATHGDAAQWRAHQLSDEINSICERAGNQRRVPWQEVVVLSKITVHGSLLRSVSDVDRAWRDNSLRDGPNTHVTTSKVFSTLKANGTDIRRMRTELETDDGNPPATVDVIDDPALLGEVGPFPTNKELTQMFLLDDPTVAYGEDDRDKMDALFRKVKDLPDIGAQARLIDLIVETGEQEGWRGVDKNPRRFMYVRLVRWALMLKPGFRAFRDNNLQVEGEKDPVNGILLFIAFYLADGVISSSDFERFDFGTIEEVRSWINQHRPVSAVPRVVVQRPGGKVPAVGDTIRPDAPKADVDVPVEAATPSAAEDVPEPIEAATAPSDGGTSDDGDVGKPAVATEVPPFFTPSAPSEPVADEAPDAPEAVAADEPVEAEEPPSPADDQRDIIVVITPPSNSGSNGGDADGQVPEPPPAGDDNGTAGDGQSDEEFKAYLAGLDAIASGPDPVLGKLSAQAHRLKQVLAGLK